MTASHATKVPPESVRLKIWRGTSKDEGHYDEFDVEFEDGESVLDGATSAPSGIRPERAFG